MESWRVSSSRSNCNNKSLSDSDPADPTDPTISEKGGQSRWLAESGSPDVIPHATLPHILLLRDPFLTSLAVGTSLIDGNMHGTRKGNMPPSLFRGK
jgi:hypothetical protein